MQITVTLDELVKFENAIDAWTQARLAFATGIMDKQGHFPSERGFEKPRLHGLGEFFRHSENEVKEWEKKHPRPQLVPGRGPFPSVDPITRPSIPKPPIPES